MKIFKINPNRPEKELILLAAEILKNGGLVVYPTDTLYGIAANALSKKAIMKVYAAKGRDFKKPLSVAFRSFEHAKQYVKFNSVAMKLAKKFLPGPLTLILPMKRKFPKELTFGSKNVGVRIPKNKIVLNLIKECGFPITATSANLAGAKDSVTADEATKQVGDMVDLIIDGGKCKLKKPSTVVEIKNNEIDILREGAIRKRQLKF